MSGAEVPLAYALVGMVVLVRALYALFVRPHLLHKLVAGNLAASGVFLVITYAPDGGPPDPVAQALVLTGIVVSVAVTAYGAALLARLNETSGKPYLEHDHEA